MSNFGYITTHDCVNVAPPLDSRCSDPAFRIANPDICPATPRLIVKPGVAMACSLTSRQFKAYLVTNGVESEVTTDCVWQTSSSTVAIIGAGSGNATGLGEGEVTVSATYQDYTATAELNVMACSDGGSSCADKHVGMMLLVDTSQSMSQQFGASFGTRLDYAKVAAERFADEVNATKDTVGLMSFNGAGLVTPDSLTSDKAQVVADVELISQTQQKTAFYEALAAAIEYLDSAAPDLKVIVLFSDGEDTSPDAGSGYSESDNPITLLSNFKDNGGIVMCLGCRASGAGFALLSEFATGGFFVNGYPSTETDALDYLSGLKGYICAGNCTPSGDSMVPKPCLNYTGFANWTVSDGDVDLVGEGMFDFIPGNGLYVDLAGSGSLTVQHSGRMVSKVPFSLTAGHQYRVAVDLAGNQRDAGRTDTTSLQVFYLNGGTEVPMLSQTVLISDYRQPFHTFAFTFTAPAAVDAYIAIRAGNIPSGSIANVAMLLDDVTFDDVTDLVNLLTDNFDNENLTYVPPACGTATIFYNGAYAVGTNCYGVGCLSEPPPDQAPDPNPLPNIEAGYSPPKEYYSTKEVCVSCGVGFTNLSGLSWTYSSLSIGPPIVAVVSLTDGPAIVQALAVDGLTVASWTTMLDLTVYGSNDGLTWTELMTNGRIDIPVNAPRTYIAIPNNTTAYQYYKLTVSEAAPPNANVLASCNLALYGAGPAESCATGTGTGSTQSAADQAAIDAATTEANAALNCVPMFSATETVKLSCPIGTYGPDVQKTVTAYSMASLSDAQKQALDTATARAQADIAADCKGSSNTQPIVLPADAWLASYYAQAAPFPAYQYVAASGPVSKVTVALNRIGAGANGNSFQIFLKSPAGTYVLLWTDRGTTSAWPAGASITIDDDGAAMPVAPDQLVDGGVYAPNNGGLPPALTMPATAPQDPSVYQLALSAFVGEEMQGTWSLWVCSRLTASFNIQSGFLVTIS